MSLGANLTYSYDSAGRVSSVADNSINKTIYYTYNRLGKISSVTFDNISIDYSYDKQGNLLSVGRRGEIPTIYEYDLSGGVTKKILLNGVITSYFYDNAGRLTQILTKNAINQTISNFNYSLDNAGLVVSSTMAVGNYQYSNYYQYDNAHRLLQSTRKSTDNATILSEEKFTYDSVGNRTGKSFYALNQQPKIINYNFNQANQLVSSVENAYSQEIKMQEESQEISALREELNQVLVDLDFRNSDLREVMRYLAETSEINIVIDENALLQISQPAQAQMNFPQQMGGMQNTGMNQQMNNGIGLNQPAPMAAPVQPVMPGQPVYQQQQQYNNMQQNQQFNQQQQYLQQTQNQQFQQPGQYPNQQYQQNQIPQQNQQYPQQNNQQPVQQSANGSGLVGTSGGIATYQASAATESSPKVTIYLKQVPLLSALDIILRSKGLRYRIEKNYIWISTEQNLSMEEMVTRIYTIQHAIGDFENFSAEALNLGNSLLNTQTFGGDTSNQFFNNINNTTNQVANQVGEKTDAQAAENLISTLKQVVPQPQGAQMTLYARTGKLIVRNTPSNLKVLEGLLRNLDVSSMQVAIEVRLLEVISGEGEDLGAVFNIALSSTNYGTDKNGLITSGKKGSLGFDIDRQGLNEMFSAAKDSFSLIFDQAGTVAIHASINALIAEDKATLLSSPKLTCLNNQTANIQVATVQNYIAAQESNVVSNTSSNYTSTSQTIGQIPEGITLEITPNVSADQKTVRLTVHPKVTELQNLEPITGYDENGNSYIKNQLPTVTQRSLDTTVSVRNGGTLVLGGLMRGKDQYKSQGISGLSKLPVVGKAFKNKNEYNAKSNLIIFITARILNAEGDIVDVATQEELKNVEVK